MPSFHLSFPDPYLSVRHIKQQQSGRLKAWQIYKYIQNINYILHILNVDS